MQIQALRKSELKKKNDWLPEKMLGEIGKLVNKFLLEAGTEGQKPTRLEGIWQDKGFEKLADIEAGL